MALDRGFDLADLVGAVESEPEGGPPKRWLVVPVRCQSSEELTRLARTAAKIARLNLAMPFVGEDGVTLENAKAFPPHVGTKEGAIKWVRQQRKSIL
jgi:hypothetical protein